VATVGCLWLFGYLGSADLAAPGFGTFSTDLLALIDPDGWSRVVPEIPSGPGECEGVAFPGLGVLLVLAIDAMLWLRSVTLRTTLSTIALGAFLFWAAAASSEIGGFQGRYAIPVLPALCPPARASVAATARRALSRLALAISTGLLVWTIVRGVRLYVSP
jgi:hypothetical protein